MQQIRMVLVDDHALFREGVSALFKAIPEFVVVGEAATGAEAVAVVDKILPDVVLMDILMPELNGLEATVRIAAKHPEIRVLILSMHDTEEYLFQALRSGAAGYLKKTANLAELELAIKSVVSGKVFLGASVTGRVTEGYLARIDESGLSIDRLTPRQREILQLVAEGHRTKDIARKLGISNKTVEMHRGQIMKALDIHHLPGLVRYAIRVGLIAAEVE
jgi:DNA-binding NarL/FixJ family response regulator